MTKIRLTFNEYLALKQSLQRINSIYQRLKAENVRKFQKINKVSIYLIKGSKLFKIIWNPRHYNLGIT